MLMEIMYEIIKNLNPETTLLLSFLKHLRPQETLTNSETIKNGFCNQHNKMMWLLCGFHKRGKVTEFGIDPENVFLCGLGRWTIFYGAPLGLLSV
jgi:hypothetical protein